MTTTAEYVAKGARHLMRCLHVEYNVPHLSYLRGYYRLPLRLMASCREAHDELCATVCTLVLSNAPW
jgi:hypothetical protein